MTIEQTTNQPDWSEVVRLMRKRRGHLEEAHRAFQSDGGASALNEDPAITSSNLADLIQTVILLTPVEVGLVGAFMKEEKGEYAGYLRSVFQSNLRELAKAADDA